MEVFILGDYLNNDRPWNSSDEFLHRVESFWMRAGEAKLEGNPVAYFRSLEIVYMSTHDFFTLEEQEACRELIKKIEYLLESNHGRGNAANQLKAASLWVGENKCDELYMMLAKLLLDYELTYLKKNKPKNWEELVDEDFQ